MTQNTQDNTGAIRSRASDISFASHRLRATVQDVETKVLAVESAQRELIQLSLIAHTNTKEWQSARAYASRCTRAARAARTLMIKRASNLFDVFSDWTDTNHPVYVKAVELYRSVQAYAKTLEARGY